MQNGLLGNAHINWDGSYSDEKRAFEIASDGIGSNGYPCSLYVNQGYLNVEECWRYKGDTSDGLKFENVDGTIKYF